MTHRKRDAQIEYAIILIDSLDLLLKVQSGMGSTDWQTAKQSSDAKTSVDLLSWHAGVSGDELTDRLASTVDITSGLQPGGRHSNLRGRE